MIEVLEPGQVLIEIPGHGPILQFTDYLNRQFGGMLAAGRQVQQGHARAVDWQIDGLQRLDAKDPRVIRATVTLQASLQRVSAAVEEISLLLTASRADRIRIHKALSSAIGGRGQADAVYQRSEVEHLRMVNRLAASGVQRAMERGEFYGDGHKLVLRGWAILPLELQPPPTQGPVEVSGSMGLAEMVDGRPVHVVVWHTSGPATSVQLYEFDSSNNLVPVEGTNESVSGNPGSGRWRFASERLPTGKQLVVAAYGADSEIRSTPFVVEGVLVTPPAVPPVVVPPVVVPPVAVPPVTSPPFVLPPMAVTPPIKVKEYVPPERPRSARWWILAAVLAAILMLLWLLWFFMPGRPVFGWSPEFFTAQHVVLPEAEHVAEGRGRIISADPPVSPPTDDLPESSGLLPNDGARVAVTPTPAGSVTPDEPVDLGPPDQVRRRRVIPTYVDRPAPESAPEPESTPEPESAPEPEPTPEPGPAPEPEPAPEQAPAPAPEQAPAPNPAAASESAPAPLAPPNPGGCEIRFERSLRTWCLGDDGPCQLRIGIELDQLAPGFIQWAEGAGLELIGGGESNAKAKFAIDPARMAALSSDTHFDGMGVSIVAEPGRIVVTGQAWRPIAIMSHPVGDGSVCRGRIEGVTTGTKESLVSLDSATGTRELRGDFASDVWRLVVAGSVGQQSLRFSACDRTVVSAPFTIVVLPTGVQR